MEENNENKKETINELNNKILELLVNNKEINDLFKKILPLEENKKIVYHYSITAHLIPKNFVSPNGILDISYHNKDFDEKEKFRDWLSKISPKDFH